jgi:hypothetical protein
MKQNALMRPALNAVTSSSEMKQLLVVSTIALLGFSVGCTNESKNEGRIAAAAKAYETGDYDKAKRLLEEERQAAEAKMKESKREYERAMAELKDIANSNAAGKKP